MPNLVEIGRKVPEGFAFNWLNTSEIWDFITRSFSSINIFFQNIVVCKVQLVDVFLLGTQVSTESYLSTQEGIPDSGIREILACRIRDPADFCGVIRTPRLWNKEYTSHEIRNPSNDLNPESRFHWLRTRYPVPGIHGVESGIPDCLGFPYMLQYLSFC